MTAPSGARGAVSPSGIALFRWTLPLDRPFRFGGREVAERHGVLVRMPAADGRVVWGDCAPLAGFHEESLVDAIDALRRWRDTGVLPTLPSARFAVGACQVQLAPPIDASPDVTPGSVRVNGVVGEGGGPDDWETSLRGLAADGFAVAKWKLARDPTDQIAWLRDRAPLLGLRLRLDANGQWTPEEAARWLDALAGLPVDYVEQPVAADNVDALVTLAARSPVAVAADEALLDPGRRAHLASLGAAVPVWIVKPMGLGDPAAVVVLSQEAASRGVRVVVTTTLESAVGRAVDAWVAATVAPDETHGLGTASIFASDLAAWDDRPVAGRVAVRWPAHAPEPDLSRLERLQ